MAEFDTSMYNTQPVDFAAKYKQGVDIRRAEIETQQAGLMQAIQKHQYMSNVFGSLYSKPDLTPDDVLTEATRAVKLGILDPKGVAAELTAMPQDQKALRQWLGTHALQNADIMKQIEAYSGTPGSIDTGGAIINVNRNIMNGDISQAGGIGAVGKSMSPGEAATPVTGPRGPNGEETVTTKGAFANAMGGNKLIGNNTNPGQDTNPIMGQPLGPVAEVAGVTPQTPQGNQRGGIPTMPVGNAPGFDKDVEAQQADLANAGQITQRVTPLTNALSKVRELGDTDTGPMAGDINKWKTILNETGLAQKLGVDMDGVTTFQQLDKYLKQYGTKAGNGSDKQLEAALGSNPNTSTTKQATEALIISQVAQERIAAAKALAFEMNGGKKGQYLSTSAKFSQEQDPRAYAFDLMTPEQQAKALADVKKGGEAQVRKFKKSLAVYDQLSQQLGGMNEAP